ncbi:plasma membrane localization protein [Yamadazyma tenuis]|uniref:Protein EFR3 n=1 Tax=Candida tenuis (strain ATCC 10573 / BCRC 21748 / CBS 615 / JCM 9827 / NBRC 10315 / NRRL Y-1498 / VKM Y-70) TaxID=590646 RepID=G3BER6_CANTC|nr:uncharacterized protein CANTEDRAFT_110754 [Yamadazyma tenuis ATCC 10573]EGV60575.1 hypothetical protein CANTEDRAFT_110754 [Yamadazyma tenuis ATCC 10573]WEJ94177.1 plasma membrane localization protein [Yamadazyma tenuis]
MPGLFLPKHQKLILQCYPPGKGVEKKPNPSELSYLLYYASTRRVKLEKVITFLNKKTVGDSNRNRFGNIQVTLTLVSSLIEKCVDNLNVFALQAVSILNSSLKGNDLTLAKAVLDTYGVLCKNLDRGLFAGDKEFVNSFSRFSQTLIDTTMKSSAKGGPNSWEWKLISLLACRYLSGCLSNSPEISKSMLHKIIPILIDTFFENDHERILSGSLSLDGESVKLSKIHTSKTIVSAKRITEDLENGLVDENDLYMESIAALKSVFNTSLTSQLIEATNEVVGYTFQDSRITSEWSERFLELCVTWAPVQLRFVLLDTLVFGLKKVSSNVKLQQHYASHIFGLVSSNVNMIGLSISDFIQSILELKESLYFKDDSKISEEDKIHLSDIFSKSIINLSTHIYYSDQVPDSVYEIFFKIESTLDLSPQQDTTKLFDYVINLLSDIDAIFVKLHESSSSDSVINRNHVALDQWQISLPLISQKHAVTIFNSLSEEQVEQIQMVYLRIFDKFVDYELTTGTSPDSSQISGKPDVDDFLTPDYKELITESTNFLSHYLVYLDKYLNKNENLSLPIVQQLLMISKKIARVFGINFLNNYIPFFFHWYVNDFEDASRFDIIKDTFASALLKDCITIIDKKYSHELEGYSQRSEFSKNLDQNISYKIKNSLWASDLDASSASDYPANFVRLTSNDMGEFIKGNKFLSEWLNAQKPLILSVLHDEVLGESINGGTNGSHTNGDVSNGNGHSINEYHDARDSDGPPLTVNSDVSDVKPGLGLGTLADIASIHSGLRNTTFNSTLSNNSFDITNGSIVTNDKLTPPKVSDLKGMISSFKSSMKKPGQLKQDNSVTPGSVLSKQMATHDLDSIIDGLDDDESFVV